MIERSNSSRLAIICPPSSRSSSAEPVVQLLCSIVPLNNNSHAHGRRRVNRTSVQSSPPQSQPSHSLPVRCCVFDRNFPRDRMKTTTTVKTTTVTFLRHHGAASLPTPPSHFALFVSAPLSENPQMFIARQTLT
ncbi:hypothetical protein RP20_CCG026881 [Aedes albopictus]|nr:hypothetical protein RP20_CCG026881 [Aedes albopictus]